MVEYATVSGIAVCNPEKSPAERLVAGHCIQGANYSDAFASAFIAPINPEIFRRRSIASAV
jgi:hypothetical protein